MSGTATPIAAIEAPDEKSALSAANPEAETAPSSALYKRKTYLNKIALFQAQDLQKPIQLKGMTLRPLIFLTFPVILYAGFSYGSNLIWFNVLNGTSSLIFAGTYNFSAAMVGVTYVSPLIGTAIGSAYTGFFGDRFVLWKARKAGGFLES
ncbi:hypothetical protein LTS18_008679, partial [Coniosporium uncinatum]